MQIERHGTGLMLPDAPNYCIMDKRLELLRQPDAGTGALAALPNAI